MLRLPPPLYLYLSSHVWCHLGGRRGEGRLTHSGSDVLSPSSLRVSGLRGEGWRAVLRSVGAVSCGAAVWAARHPHGTATTCACRHSPPRRRLCPPHPHLHPPLDPHLPMLSPGGSGSKAAPSLQPSCGHEGFSLFALPLWHRLPRGLKHPPLSAAVFSCRHQLPFQPPLLFDADASSFSARFVIPQTSPAIPSLCCFPLYVSRHHLSLSLCLVSRHHHLLLEIHC